MPLTYGTPQTVATPPSATQIVCVGANIRMPQTGEQTVTYYYEAVDASGKVVATKPVTVPLSQVQSENPADYATAFGIIKADAYGRVAAAGFPAGGTGS